MEKVTANTLSVAREVLEKGAGRNLNHLGVDGARKLTTSTKSSVIGGTYRIECVESRGTDFLLEKAQRKQITELEGTNSVTSYLREFQAVISGGKNSQESVLVKSVSDFFSHAGILKSNSSPAMRQAFVGRGEDLARRVTDATSKGVELQLAADNQMKKSIEVVNPTIKALFDLNQQIRTSIAPVRLHDTRDKLANELVKFMDIEITYGPGGSVFVQSKKDGTVLVSGENYAKIDYPGILSKEKILSGNDHPPMTMTHYNIDNKKAREPVVLMGGSDDKTQKFSGGLWGSLVDLRMKILPDMINTAKAVGRNIAKAVNNIHNDGSTYPPKTRFESQKKFFGVETLNWKPLTIHAVSKDGDQLRGGAGVINPVTIDMSKVATTKADGVATVSDLIKEINVALDTGPSRERAAIGAIKDGAGAQIAGQYLVNNMQLKAGGSVSGPNNSFTFDLDLQGNAHFGSKIEVMSAVTNGGYNVPTDQLKDSFRLEKGVNASTGIPITVENINAPGTITVEVRVTGDNGEVQRGTITYDIDPANVVLNDRIAIDSATAAQNGDFINPNIINSFSSVARAMLVDENGIEIDISAHPGATGKLVIQTADDSYCLAIQGELSKTFQFNNMFNFDELTGELKVNPKIVEDVNQLAIGQAAKDEGIDTVHVVGNAKATATLNFGGGAIANADTVTAGGQVFTFVAVLAIPADPNEVLTANGVLGLMNAINNHPDISGLVTASIGGNILTLTAKNAGTNANAIAIATNLAAATVALNGGGANGINAGNLQNGTDKYETSKVYSYSIKSKSGEVLEAMSNLQFGLVDIESSGLIPATKMSLSNLATVFTGILSDKVNTSEIRSGIATNVLEQMYTTLQDKFGIKRDEEYLKAIDDGRIMQALARLISIINNIETKAQDIIFS
jgi:flagellar hook-associated protein FlgK